ncbi:MULTISPECIES: ABC transporter substrate-binding protein [unclassified Pseudovibrio]|uniref:ABC transporter substrate-binding protein n=1 Tax=unclassified Pseudovibrio TaxID=2627060 RepID=UPI0007B2E112|nr:MULTISPECIES: ABC transporter substrate-binding protein [unclassified Pseudovibrio]KZL15197.1 Leucine-, isoleucine-, valine-, threonine-, and alanine-binding protein precursor [Pseudovibrio sp. Ad26]
MKKLLRIGTVVAASLAASLVHAEDTIKVGGLVSLSGGGASFGRVAQLAWEMAIEDINAEGGINGRKVEFILADTLTQPNHAVAEARRLIANEKVEGFIGPVTSQEVIPVSGLTTAANLFQITLASSARLTPQTAPYHFSSSPTGLTQMIPNIDYAVNVLGARNIGIISDNGGMSRDAVSQMLKYLQTKDLKPASIQQFSFRTEDMTPQLFSMRSDGVDAVLIINSLGDDSRKFLQNMQEIGWDVPVLGSLTMTNFAAANEKLLGPDAFKYVRSVQFVGMTYCPGDEVGTTPYAMFDARAKKAIKDLDRIGGSSAIIPFYISPLIFKMAIEGAGTTDGKKVAAWVEANAGKMTNMVGPFAASQESHFLPAPDSLVVVKNAYAHREDGLIERITCQ